MERVGYSYRPALDGIRAIAVASVVAYHLDPDVLSGGFLGVDVFFVLSGYLIAGLLIAERERFGRIAIGAFWVRRARRLLPALAGIGVAVAAYGKWGAPSDTLDRLRSDALATLVYIANWRFAFSQQSYFDTTTVLSPLRHTWSLAIEEQFYLLFPIFAIACFMTKWPIRALGLTSAITAVASAGLMATFVNDRDPSFVYYATHTHAQGLLVGTTLACWASTMKPSGKAIASRAMHAAGFGAVAAVAAGAFLIRDSDDFMYRGGFLLVAVAVALLIAAAVRPGLLQSLLSVSPLRWIGQRSYGLYLWHWPAIIAINPGNTDLDSWRLAALRLVATVVPAAVSYRFIETPIRNGSFRGRRFTLACGVAALSLGVAVAAGTAGATRPTASFGTLPPGASPQVLVTASSNSNDTSTHQTGAVESSDPATSSSSAPHESSQATNASHPPTTQPSSTTAAPFNPSTIAIVGDSVAYSALKGIVAEAEDAGTGLVAWTVPGCGIATATVAYPNGDLAAWSPDCWDAMEKGLMNLVSDHDPDLVVWWSSWEASDRVVDGKQLKFGTPEWRQDLDTALETRWRQLTANGARILLVDASPHAASPIAEASLDEDGRVAGLRTRLNALVARHRSTTRLIKLSDVLCPNWVPCPQEIEGLVPRPNDGSHFTDDTAPWIASKLWPLLEAAWLRF